MPTQMFLNLPVEDLAVSRSFYGQLGYEFNEKFSGEASTTVVVSDSIYLMLLTRPYFASYLTTDVADARAVTEAMIGISADSREGVDLLAEKALAAGGTYARDTHDLGFMYTRSFRDPDGHFWEVFWMDPQAALEGPPSQ